MKRTILLSLLLVATSNNFAQITIEENKIWTVLSGGFDPNYHTFAIKFLGDTTINNIVYKKMLGSNDSLLVSGWGESNILMREDSLHRIYKYSENTEELLYDFSLETGDTFEVYFSQNPCVLLVHYIDSISLNNGELRKRISLIRSDDPNPNEPWYGYIDWIQGIGSLTHISEYPWDCFFDNPYTLLCYLENGEVLYTTSSSGACFITPVKEIDLPDFKIYPNPTNGIVHIETKAQIENLSIFDFSGKEMPVKFHGTQIDLSGFNAGVYLLKATVDGRQVVRKLVVKM